jgi:hypothetical protein
MITIRKVAIVVSVTIRTAIMVAVAIGIVLGMGRSYQKICAASLVDPNTVGIESPGRSLSANRMASLPLHGYAPARIGGAVVFPAILRGTGESILRKALRRSGEKERQHCETGNYSGLVKGMSEFATHTHIHIPFFTGDAQTYSGSSVTLVFEERSRRFDESSLRAFHKEDQKVGPASRD